MVLKDWIRELNCQLLQGSLDTEVEEVVYDSRKACPGAVFVCMKGARTDSHKFCSQVYEAGARVFVVEEPLELPKDAVMLQVENGRKALAALSAARFGYPDRTMVTIGVTGTKGKTTTVHMIKAILEACGKRVGMIGTNGVSFAGVWEPTRNTTPESYELHRYFSKMAEADCEYVVMEVSSQAFKMHRTDGIFFDFGIFTNLSPDHIGPDEHKDFDEYLACKAMMFQQCRIGIGNYDDEHFHQVTAEADCPVYTYGIEGDADFRAEQIRFVAESGFVGLEFAVKGRLDMEVKVNIPGRFNISNAVAAFSVCSFFNLPVDKMGRALERISVNGRMELAYASSRCKVIIDYAHNAVSMESLLHTLRDYQPARLVVVFGCGGNRSKDRRYAMGEMAGKMADFSIITADNSRYEKVEDIIADIVSALAPTKGAYITIPDRREAITYAIAHAREGDMIAIIGKGHEDYQEVNGIRTHFLDREVVEEAVLAMEQHPDAP
ncbi:MAG: UDP-N-acetylmuramoyl-L-alanyl-D-glutamate--2,6-diaminopimelate ligase [Lachnospiraceae bacterium]|jgi:UDP-N-acetylmuramoyl-L-alanyl-D-glutamate--2,6-diaminopimelate ligase|nr:UDP-N-acetylmuramoyl-L-alanyl-D-glutamate--2,6-diaminopimelate ligase [Lachnospiraceae bacterium]